MVTGLKGERINGATIEIMAQRQFGGGKTSTGQCFQLKMTHMYTNEMANGSCISSGGGSVGMMDSSVQKATERLAGRNGLVAGAVA